MTDKVSHPVRDAWIEIVATGATYTIGAGSHPVRDAWIEISGSSTSIVSSSVASREGCVD